MTSAVHAPLRKVITRLLDHDDALNKLFPVDMLADMCNSAAKFRSDDLKVTEKHVTAAFQGSITLKVNEMKVGNTDTKHVIQYDRKRPFRGEPWITSIGRFESDDVEKGEPVTKSVRLGEMGNELKGELTTYLDDRAEQAKKRKSGDEEAAAQGRGKKKKRKKKAKAPKVEDVEERKRREAAEKERLEREKMEELEERKKKLLKDAENQLMAQQKANEALVKLREQYLALDEEASKLGATSTRSSPMQIDEGGRRLFYILDGRAGFIHYPDGVACVLPSEIENGLRELPSKYGDDYDHNNTRRNKAYELHNFGACQFFVPKGAKWVANNHQVRKEKSHDIQHNLGALFSGERSLFGEDALRIASAFNTQGYGASDESTEMMIVGWTKALLQELGVDNIDASSIAKGCPSRRTLVRYEASLAADCMITVLQEIMEDGAKHFAIITDHGKRGGLEHFVKILVWSGWADEEKTKKVIKFHCLDVDTSAHDAAGCAEAVQKSLEEFSGLKDFKVTAVTGDAGGGAAVQNLLPALVKMGVVDEDAVKINCLMHALNKCLESAGQDTFGQQGVNSRTPFQLLYVFNQLWKAIKEEGGGKTKGKRYLDEIYAIVVDELLTNEQWQKEANVNFKQAFEKFEKVLDDLEDLEEDAGIDDLVHFITETPSNIQDPVFSRWKTVMSCTRVVLNYWSQIYFVAVAVKQNQIYKKKHTSYLCTLSSTLLSLMKEKGTADKDAYYRPDNDEDLVIDDFNADLYLVEDQAQPPLKRNDTPIFYAMLLFFRGFGDIYFDDMFHFTMKDDPFLGEGSFGQISRFCVERCYIMHNLLSDIEKGNWKEWTQFQEYTRALEGVNNKDDFDKMTTIFFQRFRNVFDKHVAPCWRSDTILHYIIGGNPTLAKEFARWLVDYDVMMQDTDDENRDESDESYQFTDKTIDMGPFHYRTRAKKHVHINIKDCMQYLTADADRKVITSTPFVKSHWDQIQKLGMCEHVVDLLDEDSWGEDTRGNPYDFSALRDAIWNEIAIHSSHQQRCENYVQLAALVSKTRVGEVRRTLRAIILSTIIRPFHMWAKQEIVRRNPEKKAPRRVEGQIRGELLIKFVDQFRRKLNRAKRSISNERYDAIKKKLIDQNEKTSARYTTENMEKMKESLEKSTRRVTKAEEAAGFYDKTVMMSGGISFKLLSMVNSCKPCQAAWKKRKSYDCRSERCCMAAVHAELKQRKIDLSKKQRCGLSILEKRHMLRDDEAKMIMVDEGKGQQGFDSKDVKFFVPKTELAKSLLQMQMDMMNKEKGIST